MLSAFRARGFAGDRLHRGNHAVRRGHHRRGHDGHQKSAGVFHGQSIGLHDAGVGRGRVGGRPFSPRDARLLQGTSLPRLRQRHLRLSS